MSNPETIDRYRLLGELGRGGMGVVYRAEDPQLGRQVAVKVILFPAQADEEIRAQLEARFEREARSAAGLRHPGIITVFDFGRDGDYLFLVMELVKGPSLAERLRGGPRPGRSESFEIAARVAESLAVAHAGGVVHRDVTPRNILLADDGRVVVTDFGLARSLGEETVELTHSGMLVGSPRFMAPELVRSQVFDGRADLFSLGVVLHLMLTGQPPFRAPDITALLYQIVHQDPYDDTELCRSLGPATVAFLERCLAKAPSERIHSAEDFARRARQMAAVARDASLQETVAVPGSAQRDAMSPGAEVSPGAETEGAGRAARPWVGRALTVGMLLFMVSMAWAAWWFGGFPVENLRPETAEEARSVGDEDSERRDPVSGPVGGSGVDTPAPTGEGSPVPAAPSSSERPAEGSSSEGHSDRTSDVQPGGRGSPPPPAPVIGPVLPAVDEAATGTRARAERAAEQGMRVADAVAPVLALDPLPSELDGSKMVLGGRVMDDQGKVSLTIDDVSVPVDTRGGFTVEKLLSPGRNVLVVRAVDGAGNQTLRSVEVTLPETEVSAAASDRPTSISPPSSEGRDLLPQGGPPPFRPRYADRGDGTLLDLHTALMWTKGPQGEAETWRGGRGLCKKLELARADDWVLPTIEELEELRRAGSDGAGATGAKPLDFPPWVVWSASKSGASKAWVFDFGTGRRGELATSGSGGGAIRVLCVRRLERQNRRLDPGRPILDGPQGGGPPPPRGGGGRPPGGGGPGGGPGGGGPGGGGGGV